MKINHGKLPVWMVICYNNKFTNKRLSSVSNLIIIYSLIFSYPTSPISQMHILGYDNIFQELMSSLEIIRALHVSENYETVLGCNHLGSFQV